jgi:hypothetical protein
MVVLPLPPLIPPQTSIIVALPPYQRSVEMALKQYEYSTILALISREIMPGVFTHNKSSLL